MIALLHGYLLDGSGSNLWTQAMARSLCRIGEDVHLVCQERHPEAFDFVAEARFHSGDRTPDVLFRRETGYPGRCVLHRPELGDTLPVYVPDRYEGFERVVPMVELPDEAIEDYLARNQAALEAGEALAPRLRGHVEERHDWRSIARQLRDALESAE